MSRFADDEQYDGLRLAALVRPGHVTPEGLLAAALERVGRRNPAVSSRA